MNIGDIVRNKRTGIYGTVHYSTFGVSIHTYDEIIKALGKTNGESIETLSKYWEVIDLPEGYERYKYGGLIKKV